MQLLEPFEEIAFFHLLLGWLMAFNTTFNNISVISWGQVIGEIALC
jgi:hypothetical protein